MYNYADASSDDGEDPARTRIMMKMMMTTVMIMSTTLPVFLAFADKGPADMRRT